MKTTGTTSASTPSQARQRVLLAVSLLATFAILAIAVLTSGAERTPVPGAAPQVEAAAGLSGSAVSGAKPHAADFFGSKLGLDRIRPFTQ